MKTLSIILMFVLEASAFGDWFCTEAASERRGTSIYSCGIASGPDEDTARERAFRYAEFEFRRICGADSYCRHQRIEIEPKRTECVREEFGYKCTRLIVYHVTTDKQYPSILFGY